MGAIRGLGDDAPTRAQKESAAERAGGQLTSRGVRGADMLQYKQYLAEAELQNKRDRLSKDGIELSKSLSASSSNFSKSFDEFNKVTSKISEGYKKATVATKELVKESGVTVESEAQKSAGYIQRAYDAIKGGRTAGGTSSGSFSGFDSVASKIAGSSLSAQQMGLATLKAQTFERKGQDAGVSGLSSTFSELIEGGKSIRQATEMVNRILQGAQTAMIQGEGSGKDPLNTLVTETQKTNAILNEKLGSIQ